MFRFFVYVNLILVWVSCRTTEEPLEFSTDLLTTKTRLHDTTEQLLQLHTNDDRTQLWNEMTTAKSLEFSTGTYGTRLFEQITTAKPFEFKPDNNATQNWEELTTKAPSEQENQTITERIVGTVTTTSSITCPPTITRDILEETKKEIIETILRAISHKIVSKLEAIEEYLSTLSCSNGTTSSSVEIAWQIYENLRIPLTGWTRVFDQPYSHKTTTDNLNQIAGLCHDQVLVAATFNGSISIAAVGPSSVLTLNTSWNRTEKFGQVYWYRTNGTSFGFSPLPSIRQTSGDNMDIDSPLRLSWILDQNTGGYRAGAIHSLYDNSLWHKVIYCN